MVLTTTKCALKVNFRHWKALNIATLTLHSETRCTSGLYDILTLGHLSAYFFGWERKVFTTLYNILKNDVQTLCTSYRFDLCSNRQHKSGLIDIYHCVFFSTCLSNCLYMIFTECAVDGSKHGHDELIWPIPIWRLGFGDDVPRNLQFSNPTHNRVSCVVRPTHQYEPNDATKRYLWKVKHENLI